MNLIEIIKSKIFGSRQFNQRDRNLILRTIYSGEHKKAFETIDSYLIKTNMSKEDKITLLSLKAQVLIGLGRNDDSLILAHDMLGMGKNMSSNYSKAEVNFTMAYVQFELGEIHKSLNFVNKSKENLNSIKWNERQLKNILLSDLYQLEAKIHRTQGKLPDAIDLLNKSVQLRGANQELYTQAEPLNIMGIIYATKGEYTTAMDYFEKSRLFFEKLGNRKQLQKIYNNLGRLFDQIGNKELAIENYDRSLSIAIEFNDDLFIGILSVNMGLLYGNLGDFRSGLDRFQTAENIFRKLDHQLYLSIALTNIASIYERLGNLDRAFHLYTESLIISQELGNKQEIGTILHNIGAIYRRRGNLPLALKHYEESLSIFEEIEDISNRCETLFNLITLNLELSNFESANSILETFEEITKSNQEEFVIQLYSLSKAFILKEKDRMIDKVESLKLFKSIVDKGIIKHDYMVHSMLNVTELLLLELKMSGNDTVLSEIRQILDQLVVMGNEANQIPLIVEVRILQSKLDVLELNLREAQNQLEIAYELAEKYDFGRLKNKVIEERNELEEQVRRVSDMIDQNTSLYERIQKSKFDEYINRVLNFAKEGGFQ